MCQGCKVTKSFYKALKWSVAPVLHLGVMYKSYDGFGIAVVPLSHQRGSD